MVSEEGREMDQVARLEQMEKAQQELQERLTEVQEENRKQFSVLMDMMMTLMKDKGVTENPSTIKKATPQETGNMGTNQTAVLDLDNSKEKRKMKEVVTAEELEAHQKYDLLEQRLKVVKVVNVQKDMDVSDLSLVSELVIPSDFKIPEFEKYNAITCPKEHLTMFYRKMTGYTEDEKLLIHCFQYSLTGPAARWYVKLNKDQIQSWEDLTAAFMAQYEYAIDMAPDRLSLQSMEKKRHESFKVYAQRWRSMATQIEPPLTEREMVAMFIETLPEAYYKRLLGHVAESFVDVVKSGEMIENAIKSGRIDIGQDSMTKKASMNRKRKAGVPTIYRGDKQPETQYLTHLPQYSTQYQLPPQPQYQPLHQSQYQLPHQPQHQSSHPPYISEPNHHFYHHNSWTTQPPPHVSNQSHQIAHSQTNKPNNQKEPSPSQDKSHFDPIPISYTQLFPQLLQNHLMEPIHTPPRRPPYPQWYDLNARCEYHRGAVGHSLDNCKAFKKVVQNLVRTGAWKFGKSHGSNANASEVLTSHVEK